MGDFPVPPIARLPTHIIGKLNCDDRSIFLLYNQFLMIIAKPYNSANGINKILKERRNKELKFM
jgi:hypothetical protein